MSYLEFLLENAEAYMKNIENGSDKGGVLIVSVLYNGESISFNATWREMFDAMMEGKLVLLRYIEIDTDNATVTVGVDPVTSMTGEEGQYTVATGNGEEYGCADPDEVPSSGGN